MAVKTKKLSVAQTARAKSGQAVLMKGGELPVNENDVLVGTVGSLGLGRAAGGARQCLELAHLDDDHSLLAHRESITMEADFCREALREAAARWGSPEIVNTDQRAQLSGAEFVAEVARIGTRQSMGGRGCWRDNAFVERLWRSVKYEEVYPKAYDSVSAARQGLASCVDFYNSRRPQQSHDGRTPDMI